MITFLYIYTIIGLIFVWITLESGNHEAKTRNISFRELHEEAADEVDPLIRNAFRNIWLVLTLLFLLWFLIVVAMVFKKDKS